MRRMRGIGVATACLAAALTACGPDHDDSFSSLQSTTTVTVAQSQDVYPANGSTEQVDALDNNFRPQQLTIKAGTAVRFTNVGRNTHNVVPAADATATTWGVLDVGFQPKAVYTYVFASPGTYTYYCTIHGTPKAAMFGTIIVTTP